MPQIPVPLRIAELDVGPAPQDFAVLGIVVQVVALDALPGNTHGTQDRNMFEILDPIAPVLWNNGLFKAKALNQLASFTIDIR